MKVNLDMIKIKKNYYNKGEEASKKPKEIKGHVGDSKTIAKEGDKEGLSATAKTVAIEANSQKVEFSNFDKLTQH